MLIFCKVCNTVYVLFFSPPVLSSRVVCLFSSSLAGTHTHTRTRTHTRTHTHTHQSLHLLSFLWKLIHSLCLSLNLPGTVCPSQATIPHAHNPVPDDNMIKW